MRKILLTSLAFIVFAFASHTIAANGTEPTLYKNTDKVKMNRWVDSVLQTMTMDERIGQLFMMMNPGTATEANLNTLKKIAQQINLGGIILSKGDIEGHVKLTNAARSVSKVPILVGFDGEWGLAMRIPKTTQFPKNITLGAVQDDSLLYMYGQEMGRQAKRMGIHINFAPAIDVNSNPANPVIGYRSFGENPRRVAKAGIWYSKGLESLGVLSFSKHFPGHGDTSTDSHHTLPIIAHSRARLDSIEIYPFKEYINAGLGGVMIAHLNIPALDKSGQPSSLSKSIVTDLLQNELGFRGLVMTDGMQMRGVSSEKDLFIRALEAGNDVLLAPANVVRAYESVRTALKEGEISEALINERVRKILTYKYILGAHQWKDVVLKNLSQDLNSSYANWLNKNLYEASITLLKDEGEIVPFRSLDKRKIAVVSLGGTVNSSFVQTLRKYGDIASFAARDNSGLLGLKSRLANYNTIIFAVHRNRPELAGTIANLSEGKETIISFFINPYDMEKYSAAIAKSEGVISAYENTVLAGSAAAQAIFGGNNINGKLPVTVGKLYKEGAGIVKKKNRLSYGMAEDVGIRSSALDSVRNIVMKGVKDHAYPGAQVLIAKDGVIIFEESFGSFDYSDTRAVTNEDIFDLASMTKATATVPAIMKLYDDSKISLNDVLSKYVPALRKTNKTNISVRDALYHETGLVSYIPYYMKAIDVSSYKGSLFNNREMGAYDALLDGNAWARTDYKYKSSAISSSAKEGYLKMADNMYVNKSYTDTILYEIAKSTLRRRKSYNYSCLNFMLLKEVVEANAKMDLNSYLQKVFFTKLGASTTTYNPLTKFEKDRIAPTEQDNFLRKQLIQGYVHDEGASFMGGISGNAGLFSSANDLVKIYQMLLNGGEYGGEKYLSSKTTRLFTATKSNSSRRGLGFDKPDPSSNRRSPTSLSTPSSTYGHTGFTGTSFWIDPDNKLIYIFLSNRVNPTRANKKLMQDDIRSKVQETIYYVLKNARM